MRLLAELGPYSARVKVMGQATSDLVLAIEVVFATADRQEIIAIEVPEGTTAEGAVSQSGIRDIFSAEMSADDQIGIWGRIADPEQKLKNGDRVEIYRPLSRDPREARRILALEGRSMNQGGSGDASG